LQLNARAAEAQPGPVLQRLFHTWPDLASYNNEARPMKPNLRILISIGVVIALALGALAIALSYEGPCRTAQPLPPEMARMKAVLYRCYGPPQAVLKIEEIAKPTPRDNEVLVKVRAVAVNPLDWHLMRGEPYFLRQSNGIGTPKNPRMGVDFAGTVEAVGEKVTAFKPGDAVYGGKQGAFAEYVTVKQDFALKPENLSFEQAASVPIAGITALQGLRDQGKLKPGQKVLINGASGGVGTFAVQIAKAMGAEVTAVCSTRNVELVRSLGADRVVDYTQQDFTKSDERYDVILDSVSNHTLAEYRSILKSDGKLVIVGAISRDPWIGMLLLPVKAALWSNFVDQQLGMFIADINNKDLAALNSMLSDGRVHPVIDRQFKFQDIAAAITYLETGRARGKVVVSLDGQDRS
jgi:NADPH:quinone reductase-like Zn-dependent oxidoreductase